MKRTLAALMLMLSAATLVAQNPVANPEAVVVEGHARFTVLTDRLIRLEWAPSGQFEDHATLAIVNRNLPVPAFKVSRSGGRTIIKTKSLTLEYKPDGQAFNEQNLQVRFRLKGKEVKWYPGKPDTGNLMGTTRTLDGCEGPEKINFNDPMEPGILSRDGWAVVDE
ncbi:MAG: DUF4968 domain-containing protein, partial [Bacteroidales bacterium]|nr:DUF4968 domain-containing protein [Bacteroidales bacterium]